MAIPERGEVDIEVNGETLTLKMTMAAARQAQTRTKKTIGELWLAAGRTDVDAIRELLWVMLQAHHSDRFKKLDAVDAVFDAYGGPQVWWDYVEAVDAAAKARLTRTPGEGASAENPPQAQAGTGPSSSESQAA